MTEDVKGSGPRQRIEIDYNLLEKLLRDPSVKGCFIIIKHHFLNSASVPVVAPLDSRTGFLL
jgi:hypothetical protein